MAFGINKLKSLYRKLKGTPSLVNSKIGSGVVLRPNCTLVNSDIQENSFVGPSCEIYDSTLGRHTYAAADVELRKVAIGSFCSIGPGVIVGMGKHPMNLVSTHPAFYSKNKGYETFADKNYFEEYDSTEIGHDVWIGTRALIPGGVKIGTGAVIAAGSVVTKDVESYAIMGGVPAKILRYRFPDETRDKLLKSEWWNGKSDDFRRNWKQFNDIDSFLSGKK